MRTLSCLPCRGSKVRCNRQILCASCSRYGRERELTQWRMQLVEILPTQTQCDFLTSYFFENINWIYQVLHVPTFCKAYQSFWNSAVADIDLIWLSLLYTVNSISALCLPCQLAEAMSFEAGKMTTLSRT